MYPKRVKLFIPWSKAMVAGATVDNPDYSTKSSRRAKRSGRPRLKKRKRRAFKRKSRKD